MYAFHNHRSPGRMMLLLFALSYHAIGGSRAFTIKHTDSVTRHTRQSNDVTNEHDDGTTTFTSTTTTDITTDDGILAADTVAVNNSEGTRPDTRADDIVTLVDTSTRPIDDAYETTAAPEPARDDEIVDSSNSNITIEQDDTSNMIADTDNKPTTIRNRSDLENLTLDDDIDTETITSDNKEADAKNSDVTTSAHLEESHLANSERPQNAYVMKIQNASAKQNRTTDGDDSTARSKNPGLYTVKPTYRRPKLLEISTPAALKRDPNDNSWRNESISSLGIVFKASNASKPFTLVAKEKTESELIAIMRKFDDDDDDTPELKRRLEILSERRKMKKKPDNEREDGDGDHEEAHRLDATEETADAREHVLNSQSERTGERMTRTNETTEGIKKEQASQRSNEDAGATAETPTTYINFFEEYDDERPMMEPIIELNKFTTERALVTTSLVRSYSPERKATLEYFPPRKTTRREPPHHETAAPTMTARRQPIEHGYPHVADETPPRSPYYRIAETDVRKDVHYAGYEGDRDRNIPIAEVPYSDPVFEYRRPGQRASAPHPVLYNNSVVHHSDGPGRLSSSSSAFMKRLYGAFADEGGRCEECANVDLSPDYELHYYVADVEEMQQYERAPPAFALPQRTYTRDIQ